MVSKPALVGVMGGVAILAALGLNFWLVPGDEEDPKTKVSAPADASAGAQKGSATAPSTETQTYGSVLPKREASKKPAPSASDPANEPPAVMAKRKPSFDIVRVDPDGNTVIAGRAKPNAEVTILDGDREIGKVSSDERGEWVFLPDHQLGPGQFSLTLRQSGESETADSEEAVVLVVPEAGKDIAGRPASEPSQPLAMVLPREEAKGGATRVLQAPSAGPAVDEATPPATETKSADAKSADSKSADTKSAESKSSESEPTDTKVAETDTGADSSDSAPATTTASASGESAAKKDAETDDVSVDVIEYDDKGEVVFGGRTEPNADVEVYIDNKSAGSATADADGRWQLSPKEPVAPGNYNLRVDKVEPSGKVQARVAFPFVRAAPLKGLPNDRLVVIQPGNNLWVIATRVYGEGLRYVQIHDANRDQIQDPDLIYPGQVFGLPTVN